MQTKRIMRKMSFSSIISLFVLLISTFVSMPAHAAKPVNLSIQDIQKQSVVLYQQMRHQRHSQAEIDAAMLKQFGLQRMVLPQRHRIPLTSNQNIDLPTPTVFHERTYIFIYADFDWSNGCSAYCHGDGLNYTDDFGVWFTQNIPVAATGFSVTNLDGSQSFYSNPTSFSQAGSDWIENANNWYSGSIEVSMNAVNFPSNCMEIFTKYTHGWSSNTITGWSLTAGFPPSAGITINYGNAAQSWQATGPQPATPGC